MMNLSMQHPVPTFGDSLTITCYVCGMPSSKEWAQKARSRPSTPMKSYYPFLLQLTPTTSAVLREDGSTYLCAFCHASLEAQWNMYECQQVIPPPNRKYNTQKFICAICGVETYRKRIRALPFQEFPFLEKQRQPGSITLGNNPLAVVCLDCSETLWAQSAEYDRWGLPVHKRHFNWMARPPPPEDSVEATVARLPSGETQLPRCPPIEPPLSQPKPMVVESPAIKVMDTQAVSRARSKGKGDSPKLDTSHLSSPAIPGGRKTSLTSTTPPSIELVGGFHSQQPPVVTVAPMSSHTSVISIRKDSRSLLPPGFIPAHQGPGGVFPPTGSEVYPPAATYVPYVWGNPTRERAGDASFYVSPSSSESAAATPAWPWMAPSSSDLLRYQNYVSSLHSRARGVESAGSGSPTHSAVSATAVHAGSEGRLSATSTSVSGSLRDLGRHTPEEQRNTPATVPTRRTGAIALYEEPIYHRKGSPDLKTGKRSPKLTLELVVKPSSSGATTSVSKSYPTHPKKLKEIIETSTGDVDAPAEATPKVASASSSTESTSSTWHIPKKRNWQAFVKDSQPSTSASTDAKSKPQEIVLHHPKKKKMSECVFGSPPTRISSPSSKDDIAINYSSDNPCRVGSPSPSEGTCRGSAMDLSVDSKSTALKGAGASFRIEYLCQSTTGADDPANRTSVIKCIPKVSSGGDGPSANSDDECESSSRADPADDPDKLKEEKDEASSQDIGQDDKDKKTTDDDVNATDGKEEKGEASEGDQTERKEDKSDNEGKSERQQEDSTMHSDDNDNERKNEDLPNIEQFIKETVLELVNREKEREKKRQETGAKQQEFLGELGLITPNQRTDLELKSLVSRHQRNTLPPLQLRHETNLERKIDKELKELLLKVALSDPTLFADAPEAEKCNFMAELGMKTAQKSEKTKREVKWRVTLMERMRREVRDSAARGVKKEWEKSEILKKFASCDLDSFFSSLSYAAMQASDEDLDKDMTKEEKSSEVNDCKNEYSESTNANSPTGMCINYPKYIPSYAVSGNESTTPTNGENLKVEAQVESDGDSSKDVSNFSEPILKIPTVSPQRRLPSESPANTASDTDDSETGSADRSAATTSASQFSAKFSLGLSTGPYPLRIDSLIQSSTTYWQQMKRSIDDILNDLESSKEDVPLEDKNVHVDKLRKHLKSQLSDIKGIEKRFRAAGKAILNASRKKGQKKE